MIVSASRRTDIPAHYGDWFINRIRRGFCLTPNPFNPRQVSRIGLTPEDVDAFVFWTKDPAPFLDHLPELDAAGYAYYFLYTLNDYPAEMEPGLPSLEERLKTFGRLSAMIGRDRLIWRYDPVILSNRTGPGYHRRRFERLAGILGARAFRCVVSMLSPYRKTVRRLGRLAGQGWEFDLDGWYSTAAPELLDDLAAAAEGAGLEIRTCAAPPGLETGISPGACVDGDLVNRLTDGAAARSIDRGQRRDCRCAPSRDVGMNDSCLTGCLYCYATVSENAARARWRRGGADAPMMIGAFPEQGDAQAGASQKSRKKILA